MARRFLEVENIWHNFEEYSSDNVKKRIKRLRTLCEDESYVEKYPEEAEKYAREAAELERWYGKYQDQFCALLRIKDRAVVDEEEGESLKMEFHEAPYERPELETEKNNAILPDSQLELECTFEDGTRFGLSARESSPKTADPDEPVQLQGQIHIPEDTLEKLNAEKFKRIVEFCDRYGFSSFSLHVPMYGGEIDVDEKLADLLAKYQEELNSRQRVINEDEEDTKAETKEDEHEDEREGKLEREDIEERADDEKGAIRSADFCMLEDEEASLADDPVVDEKSKTSTRKMTLNEMLGNMRHFLEKDLHKREGLSYWQHIRNINGRKSYVFSVYDKENPFNWRDDGRKGKDGGYVTTASCRFVVSQDETGKFHFGYCTPPGVGMKDNIASDYLGEIKKAGITHLNFSNIPNYDKKVWLEACGEKGIVPKGISLTKDKIEKMVLPKAEAKLSTEEYAIFVERLMKQWEKSAAEKGTPLAVSDKQFMKACRNSAQNKREAQYVLLEKEEFEEKFKNFRDAYDASDGLHKRVKKLILSGGMDKRTGAATSIAAIGTLARTFDIVLGVQDKKKGALDVTLGERLDELMKSPFNDSCGKPTRIRITEEEKLAMASMASKTVKDLTQADYMAIFDILYKRQFAEARNNVIEAVKMDKLSNVHAKEHVLMGEVWNAPLAQIREFVGDLKDLKAEPLDVIEKHSGLRADEYKELGERLAAEEKARREAAKAKADKAVPKTPEGRVR